jgi:ABC-type uncharacterized transport system fused permease/ATPase subunit
MNKRTFEYWSKVREQGGLAWIFRTTFIISVVYVGFNLLFNYPSSDAPSFIDFIKQQGLNYVIFPCLMFFFNWGLWLYRESKYKEELKRKNIP